MTTTVQARVDNDLKLQAEYVFKNIGLNMSTAINLFFQQVVNQGKIPFELVATEVPNVETLKAMQDTMEGKNLHGPYESVEDMWRDLDA